MRVGKVEYQHRKMIILAHRSCCCVHDAEVLVSTSLTVSVSYLTASSYLCGSLSYTPSTIVALNTTSALISAARSEAAVSVEKKGLPVPQPNTTTAAFFKMANRTVADIRFSDLLHRNSGLYPTSTPRCSSASATASAFIAVPSIPIWSARVRSIEPELRPLQKLPPPTTTAICAPSAAASPNCFTDWIDDIVIQSEFLFTGQRFAG